MSCSLQSISRLVDIKQLEQLLGNVSDEDIIEKGFLSNDFDDGWNDTGWDDTDDIWMDKTILKDKSKSNWLQDCIVSLSPTEETFVVVKQSKCVIYAKKFKETDISVYEYVWHGYLKPAEVHDEVTYVATLPLASQQRSSEGNPDWTCIVAGYSSGHVRMYMMNGKLLMCQFFHDTPVINIKVITKLPYTTRLLQDQVVDELFIVYKNAMVSIDGLGLYHSLRGCRNQLARAHATSTVTENIISTQLGYHKWTVNEHHKMNYATTCGLYHPCLFDRMQKSCFVEGVNSSVKGSSPSFRHFVVVGKAPFMSIHQATDGSGPAFTDVAMAVASKLSSAVYSKFSAARSLFGASSPPPVDPNQLKTKVAPGIALRSRYLLQDDHREAEKVIIAPIGNLAAVTDGYNRVLLFNTQTGIVVRMWKGYRDAECGWIVSQEEQLDESQHSSFPKRTLFLIIYAPKRGLLSIFLMENGGRVGAFNVGKDCRLLYPGHSLLGSGHSSKEISCNDVNQCFLLKSDGTISSIHIPFHCALSPSHSTQAKDLHLLKKVNVLIEKSVDKAKSKEICTILGEVLTNMQVPSTQRKAVDAILESKLLSAEFMKNVLEEMILGFQMHTQDCEGEYEDIEYEAERQYMRQYCLTKKQLVESFLYIKKPVTQTDAVLTKENMDEDIKHRLSALLHITNTETVEFEKSLSKYKDVCMTDKCHSSTPDRTFDIASFLDCFEVAINEDEDVSEGTKRNSSSSRLLGVSLKTTLSTDDTALLGAFFFEDALEGNSDICQLMFNLESSLLPPQQLMHVLSIYTQSPICVDILQIENIVNLHSVVSSICSIKGGAEQSTLKLNVGDTSQWWESLRNILTDSVLIAHALVMAFVCRGVSMEMTSAAEKLKEEDSKELSTSGWETVTVEMEKWNFLISQLENLLELDVFIHMNHETQQLSGLDYPTFQQHFHYAMKSKDDDNQSSISQSRLINRMPRFSVTGVIDAGYGAFALIVADSLVRQGVLGPCLGRRKRKKTSTVTSDELKEEDEDVPEDADLNSHEILTSLSSVRELFPYSLGEDILWAHCAWECIMVWKEDFEDVAMLSSGLVHLSCIHNPIIQHGLGVMMWKTIFQETIKGLQQLTDKVGKAPKDRLCRKNLGLSYHALEVFLLNAKQLLEILLEVDLSDDDQLVLRTEELWARPTSTQASLIEQAADQAFSDNKLLSHHWLLVVSLLLLLNGNVRSIKPSNLFDTKGRHALHQPLYAVPHLSVEIDDKIMKYREQFCINAAEFMVKNYMATHETEDDAKSHTAPLLDNLYLCLQLAEKFQVDYDRVRRNIACSLYMVGLDIPALEIFLLIEDKETFLSQILNVIRARLASNLLHEDTVSESLSKLPTSISSWLQASDEGQERSTGLFSIPISSTFHILQSFHSNVSSNTKQYRFLNELIDALRIFL